MRGRSRADGRSAPSAARCGAGPRRAESPAGEGRGRGAAAGLCPPSRCLRAELRAPRPSSAEKIRRERRVPRRARLSPAARTWQPPPRRGRPGPPVSGGEAGRGDRVVPRRCLGRLRGAPDGNLPGRTAWPLLGLQPRRLLPEESAPGCWSGAVCSPQMFGRNTPEAGQSLVPRRKAGLGRSRGCEGETPACAGCSLAARASTAGGVACPEVTFSDKGRGRYPRHSDNLIM